MAIVWNKNFDKVLDEIREQYHEMEQRLQNNINTLKEWKKEAEVQAAIERAKMISEHSLMVLSDKELAAKKEFQNHHSHANSTFIYTLTGTGIGTAIKIKCPKCGEEKDITDMDSW